MKLLESRPVSEEVCIMSWSPKMDLIALGTASGEVMLHRLSWQKVWQIRLKDSCASRDDCGIRLLAWHPDGIFLTVVIRLSAFVIDVEGGKVIHRHGMDSKITAVKWCPTEYELSMGEVLASQARQQSDFLKNEIKIQRLETYLSALIIGTEDGQLQVFTGGFLLAFILKLPSDAYRCEPMHVDAAKSLQMFQVLGCQYDDNGQFLSLSHLRTQHFKKVSSVIGPLGFKYLFFMKNWGVIQHELTNLEDQWGKLVEIYYIYLTYHTDRDVNEVRADYMELLFTGISTVELEIFLGKTGREKDIKKHTNLVNATYSAIIEHLRGIKCAITFLLIELNEIGGFLKITRMEEAEDLIADIRKSFTYLYIGILHIQYMVQHFVTVLLNFFHLLLNTIHLYNIQEMPDFIEEDADVNKIQSFLDLKMDNSVFNFLILNASIIFKNPPPPIEISQSSRKPVSRSHQFPFSAPSNEQKWKCFPSFIQDYMETHRDGFLGERLILDFAEEEVMELMHSDDVVNTINAHISDLFNIPALSTIPFAASTYPIASIPRSEGSRKISGFRIQQDTGSSTAYYHLDPTTTFLFNFSFTDGPTVRTYSLNFSKKVVCCDLFSDTLLSVVSPPESQESSKEDGAVIMQVNLDKIDETNTLAVSVDLSKTLLGSSTKQQKSSQFSAPADVSVEVPGAGDLNKSSLSQECPLVESCARLEGLTPYMMAVSGARKLGAVLSENKRVIALVDMEPDSAENSFEDEATTEFSSETLSEVSL